MYSSNQSHKSVYRFFRCLFIPLLVAFLITPLLADKAFSTEVTLAWDANSEPNLAGYRVYYGFETGNYSYSIDVGDMTRCRVTNLGEGGPIYFAATAYDVNGIESEYSTEVVLLSENQPPVADAGPDQTVDEGLAVYLSGINSVDPEGGRLLYFWEQVYGPAVVLSDVGSAQASFTAPDVGPDGESLIFRLTVTDSAGLWTQDDCTVNVSWVNIPPTADAGSDITAKEGEEIILNGLGSSDLDDQIVAYLWEQIGGPPVNILNSTDALASFVVPYLSSKTSSLSFRLTVQDSGGLIADDTCVVNVTRSETPPTADAGPDQTVLVGDVVTLNGSASEANYNGIASVRWAQIQGTPVSLSNPRSLQPNFIAPAIGKKSQNLVFQITVTDKRGLTSRDTCVVTVSSKKQIVSPTPDIKVNGQDGPITIRKNSQVSISLSITPGDLKGKTIDLWLLVDGPQGRSFYVYKREWQRKAQPLVQYQMAVLGSCNILTTSLDKGDYLFRFAIDENADGRFDGTWSDSVSVKVK